MCDLLSEKQRQAIRNAIYREIPNSTGVLVDRVLDEATRRLAGLPDRFAAPPAKDLPSADEMAANAHRAVGGRRFPRE